MSGSGRRFPGMAKDRYQNQETEKAADQSLYEKHISIKDRTIDLKKKATAIEQSKMVFEGLRDKVAAMEVERKAEEERQVAAQKVHSLQYK